MTTECVERHLAALPRGAGQVYLSWRLLPSDDRQEPFWVERRRPSEKWARVSAAPVTASTDYLDRTPVSAEYEYRVVTAEDRSKPVQVDSGAAPSNLAIAFPLRRPPEIERMRFAVGDLNNDGCYDFLVLEAEGGELHLCAYTREGQSLWEINTTLPARGGWDGRTFHIPFAAWDLNNDGRTEVVFHKGAGHPFPDDFYAGAGVDETLVAVDGETGETIWEVPWPGRHPRVMMTVGYLNGFEAPPSAVVVSGTYGDEIITAVDGASGKTQWQVGQRRAAGHNVDIADVDGDGRQEAIVGGICYRGDGSILWEAEPFGHTDVSKPAKYLPDLPGLQILYLVEKENPGVYLVDAAGETIWKHPFGHAHWSWIGRYEVGGEQLMIHAAEKGAREYFPIYFPDGREWREISRNQAHRFAAVGWSADGVINFARRKAKHIVRLEADGSETVLPGSDLPAGSDFGRQQIAVDLIGDFRENFGGIDYERGRLFVALNPERAGRRSLSPLEDFTYRHERSQLGSGYYTYICPPQLP